MVFIYLEFFIWKFPSLGNVPENWGMAQTPSLGEFGKEPEGSHESDRSRFTGCSKVQIQDITVYNPESQTLW